jgi:hypothetical protein
MTNRDFGTAFLIISPIFILIYGGGLLGEC